MNRFENSLSLQGLFSGDNRKPTLILLLTPFLLTTFKYYGSQSFYLNHLASSVNLFHNAEMSAEYYVFLSSFVLLGVVPLLIIKFVFREPMRSFGLARGDWKFGLKAFLVLAPIMILSTYPSSRMPQFLAEYPLYKGAGLSAMKFFNHALSYLFFYIGWEIFFRGFMQFGLREKLGDWFSILTQVLASCLLHIGKPDGEIYSSIIGGIIWGIIAFRAKSILYIILIHWVLGVSLDFFICFT
ncbi:MAG TPA: CPBP family glutamic-type intramembrane protease [Bacteroidota bacterium]|nr:CPBP family glutamic-type intramembrane protease [Bacteroidota bacterium]